MRKGLFLLPLFIAGCTVQSHNYDYLNNYSLPVVQPKAPDSISIPEGNNEEWGGIISGDKLLSKLGKSPEKNDDESKSEYMARMSGIEGLAFTTIDYKMFDYDPDSEELKFSNADPDNLGRGFTSYSEKRHYEDMGQFFGFGMKGGKSIDLGSYEGSNAFGATATVNKSKTTTFKVVFGEKSAYQVARIDFEGGCKITPSEYRAVKNDLAIEYISKLKYPYIFKGYSGSAPTLDSPYQDSETIYYFRSELIAARLIDKKSMKVYPCRLHYSISPT